MVALSFYGIFRIWEKICKNTCYKFFAFISFALLPSSRFTLISDYFIKLLILKCLHSIDARKLLVSIVVPKLQHLTLRVTTRVVLLVHCIVPNVPISPQSPKTILITILLRSTVLQNLISPSSVNFAFKSFQYFTLYVNIETRNTELRSDQEQKMWIWNI